MGQQWLVIYEREISSSNMIKSWLRWRCVVFTSSMKKGWLHKAVLVEHEKGLAPRFSSSMKKGWLWETVLSWTIRVCKPRNDIRSERTPVPGRSKRTIRLCPLDRCYWDHQMSATKLLKTIVSQVNGEDEESQKLWCGSCQKKNTFLAERECWWYSSVERYSYCIYILHKP